MLERLFTSRTRVKLLEWLILNPEQKVHLRELARKINAQPTYAKKELDNLSKMGLVSFEPKGNLSLYSINRNHPIFQDIKNIFLKMESIGLQLQEQLKGLNRVTFALIYGSFATGHEKQKSDIDLLVIGKVKEKDFLRVTQKFEGKTGRELNYILWTPEEFNEKAKQQTPLLVDICKHPVIMIKGDENEFRRIIKK